MPSVGEIWNRVKATPSFVPTDGLIPAANVDGPAREPEPFRADKHYFSVVVSELFLQNGREWFSTYDPMLFALTEFSYGPERRTVPYVLGPSLLQPYDQSLPHGMLFRQTRVLGLHPFRGDDVALTLVLSRVQRDNYAADLLRVVETIGGAVGAAAGLGPVLKVADAVVDAVGTLLSAPGTTPIVGLRLGFGGEYSDSPLVPAYLALIAKANVDLTKLRVAHGRLLDENGNHYDGADYVLAYVDQQQERDELAVPGFIEHWERAVAHAHDVGAEKAWENAKSELLVLAQTLRLSPDFTREHAQRLINEYKQTLRGIRDDVEGIAHMGPNDQVQLVPLEHVDRAAVAEARQETIDILDL